jgi:FkbM family methyltransferase
MQKVGPLLYPDHETKFVELGKDVMKLGRKDRRAAYKYVKQWRRALDVGANVGVFSRAFAKKFDEVVAFEPMPRTRKCLAKNVPGNVRVKPYAVTDRSGPLKMYTTLSCGASFICDHPEVVRPIDELEPSKVVKVEGRSLDSFEFDAVDLIKLDIQGSEYAALVGARETILRHRPVILIEEKAASVEKVGAAAHAEWLEIIAKTGDLLRSYGMTAKERAKTDRVYVFED